MTKIKNGDKVERTNDFYKGIIGLALSVNEETAWVQWQNSTGTAVGKTRKTWIKIKKIKKV